MDIERWDFTLSKNGDRLEKLERSIPLESIVEDIRDDMTVLCCHPDPISDTNFKRVAYCIRVRKDQFDLFFNSRTGYRAGYYRSPFEGLRVNDLVIQLLFPALVAANQTQNSTLNPEFIVESLKSPSSKVWLAESGKEVCLTCPGCKGEWSISTTGNLTEPEIFNGRWEHGTDLKARWGSKAPYLTKLRVLGAFLDDRHNEFIPADKRFRAKQIYEFGWS